VPSSRSPVGTAEALLQLLLLLVVVVVVGCTAPEKVTIYLKLILADPVKGSKNGLKGKGLHLVISRYTPPPLFLTAFQWKERENK
jgi:hypothetical protein